MRNYVLPNPMSLIEAQSRYGEINNGVWGGERLWMMMLEIPQDIGKRWINSATNTPTTHVYCNRDMAAPLLAALCNLKNEGIENELHTFDGCFCIRDIRSRPGCPSAHSWGMAIDINAKWNQLGKIGNMSPLFVDCFKRAGWFWGGNFKRMDSMHFSLSGW